MSNNKQRGRPPMCRGTKERKQEFDKKLQSYSLQALDNVIKIAETAFDTNTRLKANIFLIDKSVGKEYKAIKDNNNDEKQNKLDITLSVIKPKKPIDMQSINREIESVESDLEDDEEWETGNIHFKIKSP